MNNLTIRILTALVAGSAVVAALALSHWGMYVFCVLVSSLGLFEFYKIAGMRNPIAGILAFGMVAFLWVWALQAHGIIIPGYKKPDLALHYLFFAFPISLIALMFFPKEKAPLQTLGTAWIGFFYVGLPFLLFHQVSVVVPWAQGYNPKLALGILFLFWTLDTLAYFGGKYLGKHKLWERISPKKTWEGAAIGAVSCLGLGFLFSQVWPVPGWNWWVAAGIIAVFGQLGDLAESMLKRSLDLKDSGGLLPGHGGLLDRFDGLLVAMPLVFLVEGMISKH